jgi:hypothetical protein
MFEKHEKKLDHDVSNSPVTPLRRYLSQFDAGSGIPVTI